MPLTASIGAEHSSNQQSYPLTDATFNRIRELVRMHTGISLSDSKRQLVYGRLVRRLRALRIDSFEAYSELIARGGSSELEEFINAITTNLTAFFRETHHFEYLERVALPGLVQRNRATRRLRIWSAACSTGEEPYSIAMVLREQRALLAGFDVKILATDLDSNVLAKAKAGRYPLDRLQAISAERQAKHFTKGRGPDDFVEIEDSLKQLVTFKQLNLMDEWPMKGPFDIIFCRNVVIYFDKPAQRMLFERIAALQRADDILCLGHSESLYRVSDQYQLVGRTIYKRV